MIFRKGDLVIDALGALRRVEAIRGNDCILDNGTEDPICEMQLVTVSMGFALAGFPVEEGATCLYYQQGLSDAWYICAHVPGGADRAFDGEAGWFTCAWFLDHPSPDLSRLPILDSWDVLPAIVRERLEALVGQEVTL